MAHIIKRSGRFYFNRRTPKRFQDFDPRPFVRIALHTDCKQIAVKMAMAQNDKLEAYWNELAKGDCKHSEGYYKSVVELARQMGFEYLQSHIVSSLPLNQIIDRVNYLEKFNQNEKHVEVLLGGVKQPVIMLNDVLNKFWEYSKPKILNKSEHQIQKWKNPRKKAINNLINLVGNKPVTELTRDDMIRFRDWWMNRIEKEDKAINSANKDLIFSKAIIETVCENLKLPLDTKHIFKKLTFEENDEATRLPFETSYIREVLLNPLNLEGLEEQIKWLLYAFAETGAGTTELIGLLPEDIKLQAEIPHISIVPRKHTGLKTKYRKRDIPLVGYALDAFSACPQGFYKYKHNPDVASTELNKFLRENKLMPSEKHSVYSLRHSFQDRLVAANVPDRIQAQLMGHKFNRPAYGEGGTMKHKFEWMNLIKLNVTNRPVE